jgi:DNA-binding transcriptional LysR family regulator
MMQRMSKFDWSDLDARLLQLLVAMVDTSSVTGTAHKLGVTQSAVSHLLDKLRGITGDPLFVKSGRGVVATARAEDMAEQARVLLHQLQQFAHHAEFDPAKWKAQITVAANDFQRDLLLPHWFSQLRGTSPGLQLRVIPSGVPSLEMLRTDECQLVISPRPPDGTDVLQKRLFETDYRVFYDPACRKAPTTLKQYLDADHATVVYESNRGLDLDQQLQARGVLRRMVVMVPGFSAVPAFVRGTQLLVTAPALLRHTALSGMADCAVPVPCAPMPMYLIWHARYHQDKAHRWLRESLEACVAPALQGVQTPKSARK